MLVLSSWSVNIYIWWNFVFYELVSSSYKWFQLKFGESLLNSGNGGFLEKSKSKSDEEKKTIHWHFEKNQWSSNRINTDIHTETQYSQTIAIKEKHI